MRSKLWAIAVLIIGTTMISHVSVRADGGSCETERMKLKLMVQQLTSENQMLRTKLSQIESILGPGTPRPN